MQLNLTSFTRDVQTRNYSPGVSRLSGTCSWIEGCLVFLTLRVNNTRVSDNRGHHIEILELNLLIHEGCEGLLYLESTFP